MKVAPPPPDLLRVDPDVPNTTPVGLGVRDGAIVLRIFGRALVMTPEQADQMASDLRNFAIEARNGGRLA